MNVEKLEYELTLLKDQTISLIVPLYGTVSLSSLGKLQVVEVEHRVGFHLSSVGCAIIFYAEDVQSIEEPRTQAYVKAVRLKKS